MVMEGRMPLHQRGHHRTRPFERSGIGDGNRGHGIRAAAKRRRAAERIAGAEQPQHDDVAFGAQLRQVDRAAAHGEEGPGRIARLKERLTGPLRAHAGRGGDVAHRSWCKAVKERTLALADVRGAEFLASRIFRGPDSSGRWSHP
jgi:hypothetical protein